MDLHRLLVDASRDHAIFALDPAGRILTWNVGAERLKGYTAKEIVGRHFSIFYPPEDLAADKPARELVAAAADGHVEDEGWRVRSDGTRFWANVVITALHADDGTLVGFGKVTRDLTERRNAELKLRESEQRFRLLVDSVVDYGIFMLDPAGTVASWNEGARRISGYDATEIVGRHFSIFYPPDARRSGAPERELETAGRDGRFEDEGWRVRRDGSRFWANVIVTALRDEKGELRGYAKVTRDLTERRLAELRALEDARRVAEAEAANRAKSEFLAALSHELRTPLNAIGGYVDLLLLGVRGPLSDRQLADLQRVRHSQEHLLGIINDLLNYSRIEAGSVRYDIAAVDLGDVFRDVHAMIEPQVLGHGLSVHWPDDAPRVLADRAKVEQILLNLLTNAMRHTPAGGRIDVAAGSVQEHVAIAVSDTGVGIPADSLESIFDPFVQVGRTHTSSHEGVGLGLAISRDLARAMGGSLIAASEPGRGATFTLTLPAAPLARTQTA
jgi:PAS domain S-box-containing protein